MSKRITAHTQRSTRTHVAIDFSRSFLIPMNFGAIASSHTRAHSHSHRPTERLEDCLCPLCVGVAFRYWEPRLHFRREIFQFSMRWPLPRSHCILITIGKSSYGAWVCLCWCWCACAYSVVNSNDSVFRHSSIFPPKMYGKILSARFVPASCYSIFLVCERKRGSRALLELRFVLLPVAYE